MSSDRSSERVGEKSRPDQASRESRRPLTPGERHYLATPTLEQTFRWADGDDLYGEYAWMASEEPFTDEAPEDVPKPYLVETWERTAVEVRWSEPPLASCEVEDEKGDTCEADAVAWEHVIDADEDWWVQVCERHRTTDGDHGGKP